MKKITLSQGMRWLKIFLLVLLSTILSILLLALTFNYYLKISGKAKESSFLKWTLENAHYSSKYLYWDYSHCVKEPDDCNFPEEQYLSYPVEIFKPLPSTDCTEYKKILFLGDSFTVAPWTEKGESYSAYFSKEFVESENTCVHQYRLASSGTGNDQQFAVFSDLVGKLKPDIVIWQFYYNDFYDGFRQELYEVENNQLKKRSVFKNTIFFAGFLNQKIPFLKPTTLGKHLMSLAERRDLFNYWSVSISDFEEVQEHGKNKTKILLREMQNIADINNFSLFTTLAPLECQLAPITPCNGSKIQNILKEILIENSTYVAMDSPKDTNSNVLGYSIDDGTACTQDYLFETSRDVNPPGRRHLSKAGNQLFGKVLFESFKEINSH